MNLKVSQMVKYPSIHLRVGGERMKSSSISILIII